MKQRIISGAIVVVALIIVLCFYHTIAVNFVAALLGCVAVHELLYSTGILKKKLMLYSGMALAFMIPFVEFFPLKITVLLLMLFAGITVFTILRHHETVQMVNVLAGAMLSVLVPSAFSVMPWLKLFSDHALISLILIFASAWLCDTGAYFTGVFFGKHKMTPKISPKKTVEGAIGGVLTVAVAFPVILLIYQQIMAGQGMAVAFSVPAAIITGVLCAFAGMLGDLTASVLKRQTGIKDYGKLLPGHGGVMDRFDSFLFTAPVYLLLSSLLPILS